MNYNDYNYYGTNVYSVGSNLGTIGAAISGVLVVISIISLIVSILMLISMWKVFKKAGKPGWASIIPIYNIYVMCEIAGKEWWYLLLFFVPIANIVAMVLIYDGISKKFGKTVGFTVGMIFLPFIFWPMLAFSRKEIMDDASTQTDQISETLNDVSEQNIFMQQTKDMPTQNMQNFGMSANNVQGNPYDVNTQMNNVNPGDAQFNTNPVEQVQSMQNFGMPANNVQGNPYDVNTQMNNVNSSDTQFNTNPVEQVQSMQNFGMSANNTQTSSGTNQNNRMF